MRYIKPIPVERENLVIGNKYFTCDYSGSFAVTAVKEVPVKTKIKF